MESIVKVKNISYTKYEEVLLRRDNLKKEAEKYQLDFIREFGDLITEAFRLKIECIRKKKMIAYCQRLANQGKSINSAQLNGFIEKEMLSYNEELKKMLEEVKIIKSAKAITPATVKKIKDIYYRLVKLIHPDMHPQLADDETIKDYWQRIVIAYRHNNFEDIEELELLVNKYLKAKGYENLEIEIEDIENKIAKVEGEIEEIISTNPYLYRLILTSNSEFEEKRREYLDEIESYTNYSEQLEQVLSQFKVEEIYS